MDMLDGHVDNQYLFICIILIIMINIYNTNNYLLIIWTTINRAKSKGD